MVAEAITASVQQSTNDDTKQESCNKTTNEIILKAELNQAREELQDLQEKESYTKTLHSFGIECRGSKNGLLVGKQSPLNLRTRFSLL